jgi:hypothetical protein
MVFRFVCVNDILCVSLLVSGVVQVVLWHCFPRYIHVYCLEEIFPLFEFLVDANNLDEGNLYAFMMDFGRYNPE